MLLNCYVKLSAIKILCTSSYSKIGSRKLCKNEGASEVDVEMEEAEKKRTGQAPMTDLSIREQQLESEEWAGPGSDFHLRIPTPDPIAVAREREQCVLSDD